MLEEGQTRKHGDMNAVCRRRWAVVWGAALTAAAVLCGLCHGGHAADPRERLAHRWLFAFRDLDTPEAVDEIIALFPRAKASGYNAVVLTDNSLYKTGPMSDVFVEGVRKIQEAAEFYGLDLIPSVMPIGYAGGLLQEDRNLAEGLPVEEALFVARAGALELTPDPPVGIDDGGFEDEDLGAWPNRVGSGTSIARDPACGHSGAASLHMAHHREGLLGVRHCGLAQEVEVRPFRQYHLSVWVKTEGLSRPQRAGVLVAPDAVGEDRVSYVDLRVDSDQDWRQHHIVFNSLRNERLTVALYLSRPGEGDIWWDDVELEETAFVNVLRRPGCPVSVRREDGGPCEEGRDFEHIRDPLLYPYQVYHEPPVVRLTADSRIEEGTLLRVSYYHSVLIHRDQVVGCLSEPSMYDLLRRQVKQVEGLLHPPAFFMKHDEVRVANWCEACRSRGLTPGELLADNVRRCAQIIRDVRPDAKIWVWSDMFDPMHNARDADYLVEGSWEGSWEGLDPEIGIVNWGSWQRGRNFKWFSDRGHEQILAGYYDWDDEGRGIQAWLAAGEGVPGITGAMYTTWEQKFDSLESWAEAAWGEGERPAGEPMRPLPPRGPDVWH